jgi:hypothetical protein
MNSVMSFSTPIKTANYLKKKYKIFLTNKNTSNYYPSSLTKLKGIYISYRFYRANSENNILEKIMPKELID